MTTTTAQPSRVSHTGAGTASAFQARIIAYCFDHQIEVSNAKARKLAIRLARRGERMQETEFFDALRILGIQSDPTAREAIYNVEGAR